MKSKLKFVFLFLCVILLVGCKPKQYTIRFMDWDDTILLETLLTEGDKIAPPEEPSREGYQFIGWDQSFEELKSDQTIHAKYETLTWTVTFQGFNQTILKEERVNHQLNATAPTLEIPEGYRFIGWDKEFNKVTSDLVVNAQFEKISFTIHFYDDYGLLLKEELVLFGESASAPTVENTDNKIFSHWNASFDDVRSDIDVIAVFEEKEYMIQFYDGTTKLSLGVDTYKASEEVILPIPSKSSYAFAGWFLSDISLFEVTQIRQTFRGNLTLYSRWVSLEQNHFTAPSNAIEFERINKNPHSSGTGYVYQPQFPIGAPTTSVTSYNWESSNTKIATISAYSSISIASSGYAIITAKLKTDLNVVYYCIIQTSTNGVVKATLEDANAPSHVIATFRMSETETINKTVQKGGFVTAPTAPMKEGCLFTGWVGENQETIYNITKNTTFIPTYILGQKNYAGKTISVLGDSISTYAGYIPSGFACFYPYPTADLADVNQTWWMQFINHYGMKLLVNNSWSGSAVAGDATSAGHTIERLQHLYIDEVKPDVILIFMGANDAPSPYITLSQFDYAYEEMIENIKSSSPNSEIVLCTLPSIPLFDETEQYTHNAVIKKFATQYHLTLIDFEASFTRSESSQYLVDSAHPNKAGMDKLAEIAIEDFGKAIK